MWSNAAFTSDRAASPVVGIVLLVAITVVIGAVVAGFTFDLGRSETNAMPSAQLDIEDAPDVVGDSSVDDVFVFSHVSGDSVDTDNLRVVVEGGPTSVPDSVLKALGTDSNDVLDASLTGVAELEAGDEVVISELSGDPQFEAGTYDITVIHEPSQGIMLEGTVKVD